MKLYPVFFFLTIILNHNALKAQNLENYTWKNRILVINSSSIENPTFTKQNKALEKYSAEMAERKLMIFSVINKRVIITDFTKKAETHKKMDLNKSLSAMLDDSADFEVLLIGLDGGIKLKKKHPITAEHLFEVIDAMPMRQSEMRRKKQ